MKKKALKITVSVAILAALIYTANPQKLLSNILAANFRLYLIATALFVSTLAAAALRWRRLLKSAGYSYSRWESLRMIVISYGFNMVLPGNVGDLGRSKIVERYGDVKSHGEVIGLVATERFFDIAGLLTVIGFASAFTASAISSSAGKVLIPFTAASVVVGSLLFLKPEYLTKILEYGPSKIEAFAGDFVDGLKSSSTENVVFNLLMTFYIWAGEAVVFYVLAKSVYAPLGFWESAFITSIMTLVSSLPLSPAGVGFVEASGTSLATLAGAGYSVALSLVILQRSISVVLVGVLGFVIYQFEELEIIG